MKKNFLISIVIIFSLLSCKKEIIKPTFNHVTISEEVVQSSFNAKPNFEINYTDNNVMDGEISIQLLDENGTILSYLPNSNLILKNGIIGINNIQGLLNKKEYFFKIENFSYESDYYKFNTNNDTTYKDQVLIKFKPLISSVFDSVTFFEKVTQVSFNDKPSFEINYYNNSIISGEISIQLLDENGTRLSYLPNANLISENGVVSINNIRGLLNEKEYFFKIENSIYRNDYYKFNTDNNTTYKDRVLIKFKPLIKDNITDVSFETYKLSTQNDIGPQKAIVYRAKVNYKKIQINEFSLFITIKNTSPWDIFNKIILKDSDNFILKETTLGDQSNWISHNDSLYEVRMNNINYIFNPGTLNQEVELELKNSIQPIGMNSKIKIFYIENGINEYFETKTDSLKIMDPTK